VSSNYRTRAIMRLPKLPERQRAFLIGLETITRDEGGWREAGLDVIAWCAGQSESTAVRARDQVVACGLVEYRRGGGGRGDTGAYRLAPLIDDDRTSPPKKGRHNADDLPGPGKGSQDADDLPEPGKVVKQAPERSSNRPEKGSHRNPATSGNAASAFNPLVLNPLVPADAAPDPRTLLAGLGADEREIELIAARIEADPDIRNPRVYLLAIIGNGDGPAWLDRMRRDLDALDDAPRPPRPPWCGECDEQTRLVGMHGDQPTRCIRCHPLSVARPEPEPESLDRYAEGAAAADDDRPRLGYGLCPECGDRQIVSATGGCIGRHDSQIGGAWSRCPGSGRPPVEPVPCVRCERTGRALNGYGLCHACRKAIKAAEATGAAP